MLNEQMGQDNWLLIVGDLEDLKNHYTTEKGYGGLRAKLMVDDDNQFYHPGLVQIVNGQALTNASGEYERHQSIGVRVGEDCNHFTNINFDTGDSTGFAFHHADDYCNTSLQSLTDHGVEAIEFGLARNHN